MKTKLVKKIGSCSLFACALVSLVATLALGTSATAQSQPNPPVCSVGMLRGLYLWSFDGYQYFGGNPVPKTLVGGIQFNGNGTLSIPFARINIGGVPHDGSGAVGTYTVAANCTGTISIIGGTRFYMFVGSDGNGLSIMQTGGGPGDGTGVALGKATRQP